MHVREFEQSRRSRPRISLQLYNDFSGLKGSFPAADGWNHPNQYRPAHGRKPSRELTYKWEEQCRKQHTQALAENVASRHQQVSLRDFDDEPNTGLLSPESMQRFRGLIDEMFDSIGRYWPSRDTMDSTSTSDSVKPFGKVYLPRRLLRGF